MNRSSILKSILISTLFLAVVATEASDDKLLKNKKIKTKVVAKNRLEKSLSFDDQKINGRYQVPGESAITVENDKPVLNLLSLRKDFKDRRALENTRD